MIVSLVLILASLVLMVSGRVPPVLVLAGALTIAGMLGLATSAELLSGLSSSAVVTIAGMLIVAQGLASTGVVSRFMSLLLKGADSVRSSLARLLPPVGLASSVVNNTPIVALSIPAVRELEQTRGIPARQLLLPLSFAATLGGTLTLIGTSSNLITGSVAGAGGVEIGMLTFVPVALPAFVLGVVLLWWVAPKLLSARDAEGSAPLDWRLEARVPNGSPLIGRDPSQAGLEHSEQYELLAVVRDGVAVAAGSVVQAQDFLVYRSSEEGIALLWGNPLVGPSGRRLYQAAVAPGFRGTIHDLERSDDVEVVAAAVRRSFVDSNAEAGAIVYLAAPDAESLTPDAGLGMATRTLGTSPDPGKTWPAVTVFAVTIALAASGLVAVEWAAVAGAVAMVGSRVLTPRAAARAIDWNVLGIVAGSIGLGALFVASGLSTWVADAITAMTGETVLLTLVVLAIASVVMTNVVTNAAAASMLVPVALEVSRVGGLPSLPVVVLVGVCVSMAFINPVATQTSVMVQAPGAYRLVSFLKVGGLLTAACVAAAVAAAWAWIEIVT